MKLSRNERRLFAALILIAAVIVAFIFVPADAAAVWKTKAEGNGLTLKVSGRTELVGAGGNTIQLKFLAKMIMLPLSFVYQGQAVQGLRVHFSYTVEGADVDWSTLVVTATATGTGGFSQTRTFTTSSGSHYFTLPITVAQLGRQPSENETVIWALTVVLRAEARSAKGRPLSAESRITSSVMTVWREGSFAPESSPSTIVPEEGRVGGGCGPPGYHLVWVSGVEQVPFWTEFGWQILVVVADFSLAAVIAYALGKVAKPKRAGRPISNFSIGGKGVNPKSGGKIK